MVSWERQPGESAPAWEAFVTYRNLGLRRSLARVGQRLGKSTALMERWSVRWAWVERCREFDAWSDAQARRAYAIEARDLAVRQAALGRAASELGLAGLRALELRAQQAAAGVGSGRRTLSVREIMLLTEAGARLEREAMGVLGASGPARTNRNTAPYSDPAVRRAARDLRRALGMRAE